MRDSIAGGLLKTLTGCSSLVLATAFPSIAYASVLSSLLFLIETTWEPEKMAAMPTMSDCLET